MRKHVLLAVIIPLLASACGEGQTPAVPPATTPTPASEAVRLPALSELFEDSGRRLDGDRTFSIALGDLEGDGDLDVLVANYLSPGNVWWNDGTGALEIGQTVGAETGHGIALGDLDGDGDLDAFIIHNGDVDQVWLNDGAGNLTDSGQRLGQPEDASTMVSLGDVDGDGDLDALTVHYQRPIKLWLNDGQGVFEAHEAGPGSDAVRISLGDVDRDGDPDALISFAQQADRIWLNDGRGNFTESDQALSGASGWGRSALGDLDGDGDLDAFVSNSVDGDAVWFNDGGAQGGTPGIFINSGQELGTGKHATLGDADGDGDLDVFTCQGIWLNDGGGMFTGIGAGFNVPGCGGVWLGDIDGDGDLDAIIASHERDNELWLNITR